MKKKLIAKVCHEANRKWCEVNGDNTQKSWENAPQWQRDSAIKGVEFRLKNPSAGVDMQHKAWLKEKAEAGWVYGKVKDEVKKTHPCIVDYDQLPEYQKKKDTLFVGIVNALK